MRGLKLYIIISMLLLTTSVTYGAVNLNNTEFYLSETNTNISFANSQSFNSLEVQSTEIVVNNSLIQINGSSEENTDTMIHDYRPGSEGLLLNFSTESSASQVDFRFEAFSKPEYKIEVNEGESVLSSSDDLEWSYSNWSENRFEVYEMSEDPISFSDPKPEDTNSDPDNTELRLDVEGPSSMDVEYRVYNSSDLVFSETDTASDGSTSRIDLDSLSTQKNYTWNATISSSGQEIETPTYSFSTISVNFSWNWTSEGENDIVEGFNVYDSSSTNPVKVLDNPDARDTELTQAYFDFGEQYCFQVAAFNSGGQSNKTGPNQACVTP